MVVFLPKAVTLAADFNSFPPTSPVSFANGDDNSDDNRGLFLPPSLIIEALKVLGVGNG